MLIKEYRIPMPMSVEEYKIAQLYMIQKKSREESEGEGSGVDIIENHPYTNEDGTTGQYTKKIYHIGRHLPGWFRSMIPKTALQVEEESWNAYPYTRTIYRCPFVDKFSLDVETYYIEGTAIKSNVFNLKGAELKNRAVDYIDIVADNVPHSEYKEEEDPRIYKSKKSGRGPLGDNWRSQNAVMCIYKLCKVEFRYWGMQSRIEHYIDDFGLRRMMVRAHRQAWVWQDEWIGLTMRDIRRLERETQIILRKKLGKPMSDDEEADGDVEDSGEEDATLTSSTVNAATKSKPVATSNGNVVSSSPNTAKVDSPHVESSPAAVQQPTEQSKTMRTLTVAAQNTLHTSESGDPHELFTEHTVTMRHSIDAGEVAERRMSKKSASLRYRSLRRSSRQSKRQASLPDTKLDVHASSTSSLLTRRRASSTDSDHLPCYGLDAVGMMNITSDDEYYDALDNVGLETQMSSSPENTMAEPQRTATDETDANDQFLDAPSICTSIKEHSSPSSVSSVVTTPPSSPMPIHKQSIGMDVSSSEDLHQEVTTPTGRHHLYNKQSSYFSLLGTVDCLFLVVHGGTVLMSTISKEYDKATLTDTINKLKKAHFHGHGRVAIRMISCQSQTTEVYQFLKNLKPDVLSTPYQGEGRQYRSDSDIDPDGNLSCLPITLMAVLSTESKFYNKVLNEVIAAANVEYTSFLQSEEGQGFSGQVCLLADCMGSLVVYDILTKPSYIRRASSSLGSSLPTLELKSMHSGRRGSGFQGTEDIGRFCFDVTHFFSFGSPLGAVLTARRYQQQSSYDDGAGVLSQPPKPRCGMFYNVFYAADPLAYRIEPLLEDKLAKVPPILIPRFRTYPMGDGTSIKVTDSLMKHIGLFYPYCDVDVNYSGSTAMDGRQTYSRSLSSLETEDVTVSREAYASIAVNPSSTVAIEAIAALFWSSNRIDYVLEPPSAVEGLNAIPLSASPHVIHSRYWEAKEFLSFVLRQVFQETPDGHKNVGWELTPFIFQKQTEKWIKKRTSIVIRGFNPGHRAIDSIVLASDQQTITGRFSYGPLDLAGEQVDVYVHMTQGKWKYFDTVTTDKQGKVNYVTSNQQRLSEGWYPVKMVVKGDHTTADCNLVVVPPHTEAVVFSVDGSFAANISISAKDVKVKEGAVEVVRLWQERGYLIIYVTGRPEFQKDAVITWLAKHQFPVGIVSCAETISTVSEVRTNKILYLGRLIRQGKILINTAYGSSKDLNVYRDLGLQKNQIYIVSKKSSSRHPSKKHNTNDYQALIGGYPVHLQELTTSPPRMATVDMRPLISNHCFVPQGRTKSSASKHHKSSRHLTASKKVHVLESAI